MTREARRQHWVSSLTLENINLALRLIGDRFDELEGRRGTPQFKSDVNMGLNRVTQMQSGSVATDGATVVQVDTVESDLSGATSGVANLTASATPGASRIVMSPSTGQYINDGWLPVQVKSASSSAADSTATVIPADDTIPQNTEGKEYLTLSFTPRSATNILVIEFGGGLVYDATGAIVALFQDTTANALACSYGGPDYSTPKLIYRMAAGTTSATTFKIRYGGSGTAYINRSAGSASFLGGSLTSVLTITEYPA